MDTKSILKILGRSLPLFESDLSKHSQVWEDRIANSRFLVVGGAGSIGSAVVRELFSRNPKTLHVIDNSENNLAELVRDLRSSLGYIEGDFHAYCFDVLGLEFDAFAAAAIAEPSCYDYVLNFSALKHVRSEKDPFTLMRLVDVNIFLTKKLLEFARQCGAKKFFCVSTDKAANPVNMMGASKRIMEMFLLSDSSSTAVSTARFANVAFSDGSLPHAWTQRMLKRQPIAAPHDILRYFVTEKEAALLCLFSILQGADREIYFPKFDGEFEATSFSAMAERFLASQGYEPEICDCEQDARQRVEELAAKKKWPCYFFKTDTTGEKDVEEFSTACETVHWDRYDAMGVVQNSAFVDPKQLLRFVETIDAMRAARSWTKRQLVDAFKSLLPEFVHKETGKYLDDRM